jgi:hypothetical protein
LPTDTIIDTGGEAEGLFLSIEINKISYLVVAYLLLKLVRLTSWDEAWNRGAKKPLILLDIVTADSLL